MFCSASNLVSGGRKNRAGVHISEAYWGYVIRGGRPARCRASLGELTAMLGSLVFGFFAYGIWMLPGSVNSTELVAFKLAGTVVFFVLASWLYLIGRRGFSFEIQLDTKREEIRLARRNRNGEASLLSQYDFDNVESLYIKRSKTQGAMAQLFLQIRGTWMPVLVARAELAELEPLMERIRQDLHSAVVESEPKAQVSLRLAMAAE